MCRIRGFLVVVKGTRFQAEKAAVLNNIHFQYNHEEGRGYSRRTIGNAPFTDRRSLGAWYLDVPLRGIVPVGTLLRYHEVVLS